MEKYEFHRFKDNNFPVTFHFDHLINNQKLKEHWHEHIEIIYCVEGEASMVIDSKKVPIKKGYITVVNPRKLHYPQAEGNEYAKYYCLIPASSAFEQLVGAYDENELCDFLKSEEIGSLMENIIKEMKEKKPYYQNIVRADVVKIISVLKRNSSGLASLEAETKMVESGVEFLEEHFKENIMVDDVAKAVGYSRYYFSRQFKKVTNRTVAGYIKSLRCKEAMKLLKTTSMSVSEVAVACGFDDISYFTKIFKNETGILPSRAKKDRSGY